MYNSIKAINYFFKNKKTVGLEGNHDSDIFFGTDSVSVQVLTRVTKLEANYKTEVEGLSYNSCYSPEELK